MCSRRLKFQTWNSAEMSELGTDMEVIYIDASNGQSTGIRLDLIKIKS